MSSQLRQIVSLSDQGNKMGKLFVIADPDCCNYTTKQLFMPLDLVVRFVKFLDISLVRDLPSLVTASVVGTFTGPCAASTTGLTSCTLGSVLMTIFVPEQDVSHLGFS